MLSLHCLIIYTYKIKIKLRLLACFVHVTLVWFGLFSIHDQPQERLNHPHVLSDFVLRKMERHATKFEDDQVEDILIAIRVREHGSS